ncbi:MAG: carbohydrate ABC transporter permease [Chloroflexota bacterium]
MPKRRSKHSRAAGAASGQPPGTPSAKKAARRSLWPAIRPTVWPTISAKYRAWAAYGLAALVSLLFCLPLYWAFIASLRPVGLAPATTIEWWPTSPSWENYRQIFEIVPLARYALNSLIVVGVAVPVTLLMASLAGFGLSQIDREQTRNTLISFNVITLMIPASAVWIFRFQILSWLGQIDSLGALILPAFAASTPLFVLLFYWSFRHIPEEMFEAARLDGAGPWMLWRSMAMPLARPTTTGVTVLTFWLYWSDFISPVLYIYDPQKYTLAIGVQIIKQMNVTNIPLLMAGATLMAAPIVVLFLFLQRFFLHELSLANLFERN